MHQPSVRARSMLRRALLALAALAAVVVPAQAMAVDPGTAVAGAGKAWFGGELMSQPGLNCSILGGSYSEIMVQGTTSYGGLSGIPAVGQGYWVSFLVSVPGNPCGPGTSIVQTDLALPSGTSYDPSRPIRCFGRNRSGGDFFELTGGQWSAFGGTGDYCPSTPGPSSVVSGGLQVGYRPVVNGQMFQVFVPVKSTQALNGIAGSQQFRWYSTATGVYDNPGSSSAWATVLSSPTGGSPQFIESKSGVQPFWKASAPVSPQDIRSRMETWVNLYTNNLGGTLCFEIRRQSNNTALVTCADNAGLGFNGTVAPNQPVVQLIPGTGDTTGPNGGYVPVAFVPSEWGTPVNLIWKFTPSSGPVVTKTMPFTILSGPDADGDGVADAVDACPAVKGTLANGCLPAPQDDPDHDGVYGAADLCPTVDGQGAFNGCPGGVVPAAGQAPAEAPAAAPVPVAAPAGPVTGPASGSLRSGIALRVKAGAKGVVTATGTVPAAAARKAGVSPVVAKGRLVVSKAGVVTLRVKPVAAARRKAAKLKGVVMTVLVKVPGRPGASSITVTLR